jgi:hypothetical protein
VKSGYIYKIPVNVISNYACKVPVNVKSGCICKAIKEPELSVQFK